MHRKICNYFELGNIYQKLLEVSVDDVDDGVVLINYDHISPFIKSGAGVCDTERNQIP